MTKDLSTHGTYLLSTTWIQHSYTLSCFCWSQPREDYYCITASAGGRRQVLLYASFGRCPVVFTRLVQDRDIFLLMGDRNKQTNQDVKRCHKANQGDGLLAAARPAAGLGRRRWLLEPGVDELAVLRHPLLGELGRVLLLHHQRIGHGGHGVGIQFHLGQQACRRRLAGI